MADKILTPDVRSVLNSLEYTKHEEFQIWAPGKPTKTFTTEEDAKVASGNQNVQRIEYYTADISLGQLEPEVYKRFKAVLEAVGGRWIRTKKHHRFSADPRPLINAILASGTIPDANPLDFFPTPGFLVEETLNCPWVKSTIEGIRIDRQDGQNLRVLEPSCGTGAFALALAERLGTAAVACLELNPTNAASVRARGLQVEEVDFLTWNTEERFPLIIMNPPFDGKKWRKHLEHAMTFLAPFGRLVCIAPKSVYFTTTRNDREFLRKLLRCGSIEENPERSFEESGTKIDTVTIFFENEAPQRSQYENYPSYDAFRFDIEVANNEKLLSRYNTSIDSIVTSLGDDIKWATAKTIPPKLRQEFHDHCLELNDELLSTHKVGVELTDEDLDFFIDSELTEFCIQNDINRTPTQRLTPETPALVCQTTPTPNDECAPPTQKKHQLELVLA